MNSHKLINYGVAGSLVALSAMSCGDADRVTSSPNFIFVLMDDMGYSDISCYGASRWSTPNIDSLANAGIRFTDCYSASAISSPSRAGFLTGRYPNRMGIQAVFYPDSYTGMAQEELTFAEVLKSKGYSTSYIGKWHLGSRERFLPLQQGFDEYYGIPYSNDMSAQVMMRGNEVEDFDVDIDNVTRNYTREAVDYISRQKLGSPFCMVLGHTMMHVPIYVSEEFKDKSGQGIYGDAVMEVDWSIGEIMKALRASGLEENTLVVFTSDNGPWLQEGPLGGQALPLREGKTTTFEGGVRVPCIAYWKGHIQPEVNTGLITLMDWMPTVAELVGAKLPDVKIDGLSIVNVLDGTGCRASDEYAYFHNNNELTDYRAGDWKLSLPYPQIDGNYWRTTTAAHDTLLFNLKEDPSEQYNLYHKYPEKVAEMSKKIAAYKDSFGEIPPALVTTGNSSAAYLRQQRENARKAAEERGIKSKKQTVDGFKEVR